MIRAGLIIRGIGELATLDVGAIPRVGRAMSRLGVIEGGAVAVDAGRFVFVGSDPELRASVRLRPNGTSWDAGGASVVPGFVDAHTHLVFAGDRHREAEQKVRGASYSEIARGGGGLYSTVRATRRAPTDALVDSAVRRLRRMARHGTTSVEVKSGYGLNHRDEIRLLELVPRLAERSGLRLVPTFLGAHAVPPEFAGRGSEYVDEILATTLPEVARRKLAVFCDVFCEPGFFSVKDSERLLRAAHALRLGLKIHAEEFAHSGGARLAARLHATSADHLLAATSSDRRALARSGVTAVLLPITGFASMASVEGVGRGMVDAGVPVALGTDLSPNSWVESMPLVMSHAVYGAGLTPAEALSAATVNAAHAVGLSDSAGRIAVGLPADFSVFPTSSVEEIAYRVGAIPERVYRQGIRVPSR